VSPFLVALCDANRLATSWFSFTLRLRSESNRWNTQPVGRLCICGASIPVGRYSDLVDHNTDPCKSGAGRNGGGTDTSAKADIPNENLKIAFTCARLISIWLITSAGDFLTES
jgi:hypothetical protein